MKLLELTTLASIVAAWAQNTPSVNAAWLFGSRVKGNHNDASDLDVAIALEGPDEGFANWICDAEEMRQSLAALLPVPLDLQMVHSTDDIVKPAVQDHGILVFERVVQ